MTAGNFGSSSNTPPITAPAAPAAPLVIPGFDVAAGLKRIRGNEKLYRRLLTIFVGDIEKEIALYPAPPAEAIREDVRGSAHKIKGAAANLNADELHAAAAKFEGLAKDPAQPFGAVLDEFPSYIATLQRTLAALKTAVGLG
jgi:HPt (histidine-containing phosphotransfer) domain-containing protein